MSFDDEPTQRIYSTSVGLIDYATASAAVNAIADGQPGNSDFRCLTQLFDVALHRRVVSLGGIQFSYQASVQLLFRLRARVDTGDLDTLWSLIHVLFDR